MPRIRKMRRPVRKIVNPPGVPPVANPRRPCITGMYKHPSKGSARADRARIARIGEGIDPEHSPGPSTVFRCGECGGWHVGHRPDDPAPTD